MKRKAEEGQSVTSGEVVSTVTSGEVVSNQEEEVVEDLVDKDD